jgi:hypothetical protein
MVTSQNVINSTRLDQPQVYQSTSTQSDMHTSVPDHVSGSVEDDYSDQVPELPDIPEHFLSHRRNYGATGIQIPTRTAGQHAYSQPNAIFIAASPAQDAHTV